MKKTYKNPELKVVALKTSIQLLTQSNVAVGQEYGGTTILSREQGDSFWDDEEE